MPIPQEVQDEIDEALATAAAAPGGPPEEQLVLLRYIAARMRVLQWHTEAAREYLRLVSERLPARVGR